MPNVKNNHGATIVSNVVTLEPGENTVTVEQLAALRKEPGVQIFVDAKLLEFEADKPAEGKGSKKATTEPDKPDKPAEGKG